MFSWHLLRGGGGVKPYCLRLSLRQSAIGTYCVGLDILWWHFSMHIRFLIFTWQPKGGGGLNPLNPPPPRRSATVVEARLKKWLNFDVCVVLWCSDGSINSQGYKSFDMFCSHYQDIYDGISPLNKRSGSPFILAQQSMGGNEYGKSGHLSIFTVLKHLMMLLKCNFFQGFRFTLDQRHWFLKVKTLLNNAFNYSRGL